jgi:hypothetical protein
MMYFIVALAARRRRSRDYLVICLWNMAKIQYFVGIYILYCTRTL